MMFYAIPKMQTLAIEDVSHRPLTERLISLVILSKLIKKKYVFLSKCTEISLKMAVSGARQA